MLIKMQSKCTIVGELLFPSRKCFDPPTAIRRPFDGHIVLGAENGKGQKTGDARKRGEKTGGEEARKR